MEFEKYIINFGSLQKLKLGDETINNSDYLNIKIVNYAPKSFAYLRQIEDINIDKMIESFLPKNNTQGLKKSQGMDNNIKKKIDEIVNEIGAINDLNIKHAVLTYMEQQAGFMLWQMEDEKHIDNDSHNV